LPVVTERGANGLPQRRRKAPPITPAPAPVAPARTAPEPEPESQVQPGVWLAAFQSGLSGDTTTEDGDASSASASKGKQQ
jgi:hypothetical protein